MSVDHPSLFDEPSPVRPPAGIPKLDAVIEQLVRWFGFDKVEAAVGRIRIQMSGPLPQVGERTDDQRTSIGNRSADVRRFSSRSQSGRLLQHFNRVELTDSEATDKVMGNPVLNPSVSVGSWEGCRRRCSDLREAGYLTDTIHERDGRIVWAITPQGIAAAQLLRATGWSRPK